MTIRGAVLGAVAVLALPLSMAACSSSGASPPSGPTMTVAGDTVASLGALGPTSFAGVPCAGNRTVAVSSRWCQSSGPFAAGEATLMLGAPYDAAVELWYPATKASVRGKAVATYNVKGWLPKALAGLFPPNDNQAVYATGAYRGVPVAGGRFPLVVFAHGYSGYRDQSTFLTSWLATWGFVVAAPDMVDYDLTAVLSGKGTGVIDNDVLEMEAVISLMASQDSTGGALLDGHVDMHKIAAMGHSMGGAVSEALASADSQVSTFVGLAGATVGAFGAAATGPASEVPSVPGMLMVGTNDGIVSPSSIETAYADLHAPKQLVTLSGFGHLVFADICEIAPGQGGLLALAKSAHLTIPSQLKPLATDGCLPPDNNVTAGWPVIRQAVTAWLRHAFGFDRSWAGLSGLSSAYAGVVAKASIAS